MSPSPLLGRLAAGVEALRARVRPVGAQPVGVRTLALSGSTAELWYPAAAGAAEVAQAYAGLYRGQAARDAVPAAGGRWPLVLISHGLMGTRYDLAWLAEACAAAGMAALALDHPHSGPANFVRERAVRLWERAHALSAAADALAADAGFGSLVDLGRLAVAGHSAGGSTALVAAGARLSPPLLARMYPFLPLSDAATPAHDPRLRAAVLLAPGTGIAFSPEGLAACSVPVFIASGSADTDTPDVLCAQHFARHLPRARWHRVIGGGHYVFRPCCVPYGLLRSGGICRDAAGVSRATVHREVALDALAHLAAAFAATPSPPASRA